MEREIQQLKSIIETVLPQSLELKDIDVVMGSLGEGQQHNFKAVIRVHPKYHDPIGTAGWVHELMKRVRLFWGRDDLYIEVQHEFAERQP